MNNKLINIVSLICAAIIIFLMMKTYNHYQQEVPEIEVQIDCIRLEQPEFLLSDNPEEDLVAVLEYYEIQHSDIVKAQAILETGHFRSKVFREYNNLFGLYDSRKKDYYRFNHWSESVKGYIDFIQYRYEPPEDYYHFLDRIGYAEDPNYISKVKSIVNRYK